jgi:hypothetical protein
MGKKKIRGYKGFDKDLRCRGFQYEVGKEYRMEESPIACAQGFHFCRDLLSVNNQYRLGDSRVCVVEVLGEIDSDIYEEKFATNRIKIVRELSREEITRIANIGKRNSGVGNVGDKNAGDFNTGVFNEGSHNTGDNNVGVCNTSNTNYGNYNSGVGNYGNYNSGAINYGSCNSGDYNSGHGNSGSYNAGSYNTGCYNSGDGNTGRFNSASGSAGVFMSRRISYEAFNKRLSAEEYSALTLSPGFYVCERFSLAPADESDRSAGCLGYKESWRLFWEGLTCDEQESVRQMPSLDEDVFFDITGIRL